MEGIEIGEVDGWTVFYVNVDFLSSSNTCGEN